MVRVGILGVTGYAGEEVLRLLMAHDGVSIAFLGSSSSAGKPLSDFYPAYLGADIPLLSDPSVEQMKSLADVVFVSLPHGASKLMVPALYEAGLVVIDLSGDFRYDDAKVYEQWYNDAHNAPELLAESVYGLAELHREKIKETRLIANPGCYTTCSILGLAPAVKEKLIDTKSIVIDAKSGASGAGRKLSEQTHFCTLDESMKAYNVGKHRHTSEIEQELSKLAGEEILLSFTPHLLPVKRGILATCYANLLPGVSEEQLRDAYADFFKDEKFVCVYDAGKLPELRDVVGSNRVAIGFVVDKRLNRLIVVSCLDNLIKGAAGQAVQNMNIKMGLSENAGLPRVAWSI